MPTVIAAIALGSNLGDRQGHIARAFEELEGIPGTRVLARGPVVETAPVGAAGVDPGGPYLNSAALIQTELEPRVLLEALHGIERTHGRDRSREQRWAPRTLDLDLLTYGDRAIDEPGLTVPHPRLHERRFVLEPLAAIAPGLDIPGRGTAAQLLAALEQVSPRAGVEAPLTRAPERQPAPRPTVLVLGALCALGGETALAQPPKPPEPVPPTPASILHELQRSYRTQSTCERIQLEVRSPAPPPALGLRTSRSSIIARILPGSDGKPPSAVSLELGQIHVWVEAPPSGDASGGKLIAVHDRDPASYFDATLGTRLTPAAIGEILPPIPIPELDLGATAPDAECAQFWPYATGITWQSVMPLSKQPGRTILHGVFANGGGAGGTVDLTVQNAHLRTLVIDQPANKVTLTMSFLPTLPCEPGKAAIATAGRTRVASMDELRPVSGTLRVGVRVPNMPITQGPTDGWDMGGLLQPPATALARGVRPAEHVVLVFLRDARRQSFPAEQWKFDQAALAASLKSLHDQCFAARIPGGSPAMPPTDKPPIEERDPAAAIAPFGYAPVLVLDSPKPEEILDRLAAEGKKWGPDVLWTTEPHATIDKFTPNADASVVILDSEYVLRAVIPIDPTQTADRVMDQITAALFELAPTETR